MVKGSRKVAAMLPWSLIQTSMSYLGLLLASLGWFSLGCFGAAIQAKVVAFSSGATSSVGVSFRRGSSECFSWAAWLEAPAKISFVQ